MDDSMLNETLQKLSASINQQAVASINSINIPEFRGLPEEDIYDFLTRFKVATFTLPDDYRCLALNKALKGAALIWAKSNIKNLITEAKWREIKSALYDRFGSPDRTLNHRQKLSKLKFNESSSTLMAYIENYIATYRKAFRDHKEQDAIQSLRLNLPDRIVKGLNYLDDGWSELRNIKEFLDLVKRYETRIMPFETRSESGNSSLTKEVLQSIFKEFRDSINEDIKKSKEENQSETKALGAMMHAAPEKRFNNDQKRDYHPRYQNNYNRRFTYKKPRYEYSQSKPMLHGNQSRPAIEGKDKTDPSNQSDPNNFVNAYYAKYGRPPGPCYYCQGIHLNKHCPLVSTNLN